MPIPTEKPKKKSAPTPTPIAADPEDEEIARLERLLGVTSGIDIRSFSGFSHLLKVPIARKVSRN